MTKAIEALGGLTIKQRRLIQDIVSGKSVTDAMLDAGYSRGTSSSQAHRVLNSPKVKRALLQAMDKKGLTDEKLAKRLAEGVDATKVVRHQGAVVGEDPDHYARHMFLRTTLELRGDLTSIKDAPPDRPPLCVVNLNFANAPLAEEHVLNVRHDQRD